MRFGHFFYPMNLDASRDCEAIEECLAEAELVEQLGFDAIWIAEHHFIGEAVGKAIALYRETMLSSGFDEAIAEDRLDNSWFWYESYLAETDDEAFDEFLPAWERAGRYVAEMRERWNPKDQEAGTAIRPLPRSSYGPAPDATANEILIGSPGRVAEHLRLLGEVGVRNLMLTNRGLMSKEQTESSLRLLSEKVMPQFR